MFLFYMHVSPLKGLPYKLVEGFDKSARRLC